MGDDYLVVEQEGKLARVPVLPGNSNEHVGWDSAGNDAPHDGHGIGNHAGDHTDHKMFVEADRLPAQMCAETGAGLSIEQLLQIRSGVAAR